MLRRLSAKMSRIVPTIISEANVASVVEGSDAFLFDMDGVLWTGAAAVPQVEESIELLRERGKKIVFVTNNASRSRAEVVKRLSDYKIRADVGEVFSSAYISAEFLHKQGFDKKVFVIGNAGLRQELAEKNIRMVDAGAEGTGDALVNGFNVDPEVGAVVVGLDTSFSYNKLAYANLCLRTLPSCELIATNPDYTFPNHDSQWPGAGSLVAAVAAASGRVPLVMGKPEPQMLERIIEAFNLDRSRTCMVGDRMDTDVLFAKRGGVKSLLVLTGVDTLDTVETAPDEHVPEMIIPSLGDIAKWMRK